MTNRTYKKTKKQEVKIIPPHGGYKKLEVYKTAVIIEDGTFFFCKNWIKDFKLISQMNGAARSGKQCIAEGSLNSGTSKKLELKLVGNARGSFGELLEDFEDFLRQRKLPIWEKDDSRVRNIRGFAYKQDKSYETYKSYIENENSTTSANTLVCLIHQENFLLDRLKQKLESDFLEKGGFTEKMFEKRKEYLRNKSYESN